MTSGEGTGGGSPAANALLAALQAFEDEPVSEAVDAEDGRGGEMLGSIAG
jgi:hypothetical protein